MVDHTYLYNVKMTCGGCSGAVTRALNKKDGVLSVDASLKEQTVKVSTNDKLTYEQVLEVIKKTGKEVTGGKEVTEEEITEKELK